ncbi:hypothetical protein GMORB2_5995 [Geosmithia morbida]|uniref:Uncharacterized protein n=1 Tax=Geosmithia morbida TaxID=1094350 RepID=A0A9P5D786_9HYPO|nr:uncharacterized protein GMORB2_5995 [Geosmithia morbida]KAF4124279.1 hypothetical protein GMORB2_5995 [Geosmithia morbida]
MAETTTNYVIFPVFIIVLSFLTLMFIMRRRNRRRNLIMQAQNGGSGNSQWPGPGPGVVYRLRDRGGFGGAAGRVRGGGPGGGHGGRRRAVDESTEGLNELGEAPPPYDGKREAAGPAATGAWGQQQQQQQTPGQLEAGLPGYYAPPAEPPAAATR